MELYRHNPSVIDTLNVAGNTIRWLENQLRAQNATIQCLLAEKATDDELIKFLYEKIANLEQDKDTPHDKK